MMKLQPVREKTAHCPAPEKRMVLGRTHAFCHKAEFTVKQAEMMPWLPSQGFCCTRYVLIFLFYQHLTKWTRSETLKQLHSQAFVHRSVRQAGGNWTKKIKWTGRLHDCDDCVIATGHFIFHHFNCKFIQTSSWCVCALCLDIKKLKVLYFILPETYISNQRRALTGRGIHWLPGQCISLTADLLPGWQWWG